MRKLSLIGFIMAMALVIFSNQQIRPASAQGDKMMKKSQTSHTMTIKMTGRAEVPGPGDPDGSGMAKLTFNHDKGEVCYDLTTKKVQTVSAAHIHSGVAGQAGPPKVTFSPATKGCVSADKALIEDIMANPGNYYVNVHNSEFTNGALRGQLGK